VNCHRFLALFRALPATLALAGLMTAPASAQPVARRAYGTAEGLAHDWVVRIRTDSRGLLWFATYSGLSRFDRVSFVNYRVADGLPDLVVNDVFEDREGRLWVPTNGGGVARILPHDRMAPDGRIQSGRPANYRAANRVNVVYQDADGALWAGSDGGLFLIDNPDAITFTAVPLGVPGIPDRLLQVLQITSTANGDMWLATRDGLVRRAKNGVTTVYNMRGQGDRQYFSAVLIDSRGVIWAGGERGLVMFRPPASDVAGARALDAVECQFTDSGLPSPPVAGDVACRITGAPGTAPAPLRSLHQLADGTIVIGTTRGAMTIARGRPQVVIDFPDEDVQWVSPDVDGSLWLGTSSSGALHLVTNGFASITRDQGLADNLARRLFLDREGRVTVIGRRWSVSVLEGTTVRAGEFRLPAVGPSPSPWENAAHRDRRGEWWVATGDGLFRFPNVDVDRLSTTAPIAVYTEANGLPSRQIAAVFEDSRGGIWAALNGAAEELARWDRTTQTFQVFGESSGLPKFGQPICFAEDRRGNIWVGFREGGMARYAGGRFQQFGEADGVLGHVRTLFVDDRGRLWIGQQAGVGRIDDPNARQPEIKRYTVEQGLSSNEIYSVTADALGRVYIGTERGIDRLDPNSGAVTNFGLADGLPPGRVHSGVADRDGRIWFGTFQGISRFTPGPELTPPAPGVLIGALRVAGTAVPVSPLGAVHVADLSLPPGRNLLEVWYFGLAQHIGERLRFQHRLEGEAWSAPTYDRSFLVADLSPGRYRFEVRAINSLGMRSLEPAVVTFRVQAPPWARWWFLALAAALPALIAYAGYRYRLAQLIHVERVRSRIATDLHDDIGASLSQIAILAEVLKQTAPADAGIAGPLTRIAHISRSLVEGMSDIVWAINPKRDSLKDLLHRMRRFAEDTLGGANIALTFTAPAPSRDRTVGADLRRDVLLILKECITNIARHSEATEAQVEIGLDGGSLWLKVADNGRGFVVHEATDGNGLDSMRKRIAAFGGVLEFTSAPGEGSSVFMKVSLSAIRRATTHLRSGDPV
jgi:signal transduction histidine kinase/ligand-binding sensor domain-containing protein